MKFVVNRSWFLMVLLGAAVSQTGLAANRGNSAAAAAAKKQCLRQRATQLQSCARSLSPSCLSKDRINPAGLYAVTFNDRKCNKVQKKAARDHYNGTCKPQAINCNKRK